MKQILCRILVLLAVIAAILGLSSCNIFIEQEPTVYDLVVNHFDREVVYGTKLDLSGLEIEATTGDDVKYIPVNSGMIVGGDTNTVGAQELVIEYDGFSWTLAYEVFYKVEHIVDGLVYDSQLVSSRDEIIYFKDPEKSGSIFLGWSTEMPETLTGNVRREAVFVDNITLPKLSATYGDTLGDIALPAVSGGQWHWQDSEDTSVGNAGTNEFKLVYVFDDTSKGTLTFDVDVEVAKKHVDIIVGDDYKVFEYNGKANTVVYELSENVPAEDVIVFGSISGTEIGEYSYTIRIFNDNYEGQYTGSFEINPIDITISVLLLDPADGVYKSEVVIDYGNSFPEYKIVITDKNGEEYKLDAKLSVTKPVLLKAGEHSVTTSFDDEHYNTKIEGATLKVNAVDIDPGEPKLVGAENVTYGDKLSGILFEEHQLGYWKWDLSGGDTVGNAGKNTVTAIFVPKDSSYNEYRKDVVINVSQKRLTFEITSSSTFIYSGKEYGLTFNVIDPNSREVVSGLKVLGNEKFVNAGKHEITLTFEDNNYLAIENTFTLTIAQAATEKDFSFIVDDVWFQGITLSDIPLPDGFKWDNPGIQVTEPGGYAYAATFYPTDSNYATASGYLSLVLDKATPSLTTDKKVYSEQIYNGAEYKLSGIIVHDSNSDKRNNVEYYISGTDQKITGFTNAGTYNVDVVVPESTKYKSVKISVVVVVNKATPSISRPIISGWTFGSDAVDPTSSSTQVEIAGFNYYTEDCGQYTKLDGVPTNAGTYYVSAYSLENENYYAGESEYRQFEIAKFVVARPVLTAGTYTGGTQYATVPPSDLYKVAEGGNPARINAGTYDVVLELLDSANYIWNNGDEVSTKVSFKINQATLTLSPITGSSSFKYDDPLDFATTKGYTTDHAIEFGEVVYLYASLADSTNYTTTLPRNIGTYLVKAVIYSDEDGNWKYVETAPVQFEITKRPIPVPELSAYTSVFNGKEFVPTAEANDLIYTIEYQNENSINMGEYIVSFTIIDANYMWADGANGVRKYTITAATPELYDVVSDGWTFGSPITHSASAKITSDGNEDYLINVENAVKVTYYNSNKVAINKPSSAGTYYIRFTVAEDATNGNWIYYTSDYIEFEIEQFALDIPELVGTGIYTYKGSDITLEVTETEAHKAHYAVTGNEKTGVGTYTATYTLENSNYKWADETTADKTINWSVVQAATSVTSLSVNGWTFNDDAIALTYTAKTETNYTIPNKYVRISFRHENSTDWTTISTSEWLTNGPKYAGNYDVKVAIISDEDGNWAPSESSVSTLNIAKDDYDMSGVSWNYSQAFEFNDKDRTVSITGTLPAGVAVESYTGNVAKNAGTYTANVKFSYDSDNYNEPTIAPCEWKIDEQIVAKPNADTTAFTYNTDEQKYVLATHSGYTISGNLQTNAGTHIVTVTLNNKEAVNYVWDDGTYDAKTYDFVISPKAFEDSFVTLTNTLEYNGTAQTQTIQVKFRGEVLVLDTDYTVTDNVQTDAGNYELTVTAKEGSNYTGTLTIGYSVGRKPIGKPSAATGLAFNNGTLDSGIYTVEGQWTVVDTANAATVNGVTPAGNYKVTVTLNNNYKWNDGTTADLELPYLIDKATITLTNLTAQYPDGANSWTFGDTVVYVAYKEDGSQTFGTINYHYLKEGSTVWTDAPDGVGNYTVRASIDNNANWYEVEPKYSTFTLNAKALSNSDVTHTYNNLTYTGLVINRDVTVTVNGKTLIEGTDYTLSIDKTVQNAGDYTITVTGKGNYSGTITKTFSVAKKALSEISTTHTYHNNDAEKTTLVYTGDTFGDRVVLKYGDIALVKGTDYTISITEDGISADSVKNAGDYVIVVTAAENGNYSGTVTITFSVDVKTVNAPEFASGTVTTLVYNHNATDAAQPKLSDSADADYYDVTYPTFNKNVGTYMIVATLESEHGDNIKWSDNTVANKTFNYYIVEKEIVDSDVSHTYNNLVYKGSVINGTVTVTVNGKTLIEGTDYTLSIDKTVENAGDYTITVTGNGNYSGTVTKGFTVAPANETVSFSKVAETAGSFANGTLTLTYTGEIDVRNFITATLNKSTTAPLTDRQPEITGYALSSAGDYIVTYTYAATDDGNYAKVVGTVKVVINAVTNNNITLTANYVNGTEWRYEDAVKYSASAAFGEITLVYYKLVDGVYVEMEDFVPGVTILDHGDYKVVATIEATDNYNGDVESIEFEVKKRIIHISANNSTYDGQPHDSGLTDTDYYRAGLYTVREHTTNNIDHGTYYVTATLTKSNNYAWADDNDEASKEFDYQIASRANKLENYKLLDKDGNSVTTWTYDDVIGKYADVLYKADGDTLGYVVEYKAQADYSNDAIPYTIGIPANVGVYVVRFRTTDENATIEYGIIQNVTISAKNENAPVIAGKPYDNTDYETGLNDNDIYTVSGDVTAKDAGTYTVVLTLLNPDNRDWKLPTNVPENSTYTISGEKSEVLTIKYRITTATVDVKSVTPSKPEWKFDEDNATLTVVPEITIKGVTFTYTYTFYKWNDATQEHDIPVEDADDISDIENVGNYKVIVTLVSAGNNENGVKNYEAGATASCTFEIKQLVLDEVSLSETSREFNNAEFKPTVNNFNSKYCDTVDYAGADASFKNYGSYTATVSIKSEYVGNVVLANNNSSSVTLDYSITSATPTIAGLVAGTWKFNENGTGVSHSATVTVPGATLTEGTHYHIVYYVKNGDKYVKYGTDGLTAPKNAGTNYSVRVEVKAAENLNWAATNSEYVDFVIDPDTVDAPVVSASRPFNNGIQTSGWVTVDGKWTVVDTGVDATENGVTRAGNNYTATITLNSNYQWNAIPENVTNVTFDEDNAQIVYVTYSIVAINIGTDSVTKVENYANLSYTGQTLGSLTLKFGDVTLELNKDYTVSITRDGEPAEEVKNAGDYVIIVAGKGNYTGTHTIEFKVDKKTLTVPVVGNFVYNESTTPQKPTISVEGNKLPTDTTITNNGGVNVGDDYKVILTLTDESFANHEWGTLPANATLSKDKKTVTITYEITPKPVDAPTINGTYVYGEINGVANSHEVEFNNYNASYMSNDAVAQTQANSYTVTIKLTDLNYAWREGTIVNNDGNVELTWIIATDTTNVVTIAPADKTEWTYGDQISYSAFHKYGTLSVTYIDNATGEEAEFVNGTLPVGSYTVSATLTVVGHNNYNGGSDSVIFTVNASTAEFKPIDKSSWNNKQFGSVKSEAPSPTVFLKDNENFVVSGASIKVYYKLQTEVSVATFSVEEDPWTAAGWTLWTAEKYPSAVGKYDIAVVVEANDNYNTYSEEFEIEILKANTSIDGVGDSMESTYGSYTGPKTKAELLSGVSVKREDETVVVTPSIKIDFVPYVAGTVWDGEAIGSVAGTYTITYSYTGDDSHNAATNVVRIITINKTTSTISGATNGQVIDRSYNEQNHLPTVTINGIAATPAISYTAPAGYEGTIPTNGVTAGTYVLTYSFAGDNNYESMSDVVVTLNIAQVEADTTVISGPYNATYGDSASEIVNLPADVTGGEWKLYNSNKTTLATTVDNATEEGKYNTFYARFESSDVNYASTDYIKVEISVAKADSVVDIEATDGFHFTKPYNGKDYLAAIKADVLKKVTTDGDIEWSGATAVNNAGTYTVTISISEGANYNATSKDIKIEVTPADFTSVSLSGGNVTYNGSAQQHGVTVKGVNDTVLSVWDEVKQTGDYKVSYSTSDFTNVGEITVTVTGMGNYAGDTWSDSYEITPKALVNGNVSLSGGNVDYDGEEHKYTVTVTDVTTELTEWDEETQTGDYTVTYSTTSGNYKDVGTITVTVTGKGNYKDTVTKTYTIGVREIDAPKFDVTDLDFTYGDGKTLPELVYDSTYCDVNVSAPATFGYAGTYTYTVTLKSEHGDNIVWVDGANDVDGVVTLSYEIKQKALTNDDVILYNQDGETVHTLTNITYNGSEQKPTVTVSGLTLDKDYTVTYSRTDNVSEENFFKYAGIITVTVTGKGNYAGSIEKTYTINKVKVELEGLNAEYTTYSNGNELKFIDEEISLSDILSLEAIEDKDGKITISTDDLVWYYEHNYAGKNVITNPEKIYNAGNYKLIVSLNTQNYEGSIDTWIYVGKGSAEDILNNRLGDTATTVYYQSLLASLVSDSTLTWGVESTFAYYNSETKAWEIQGKGSAIFTANIGEDNLNYAKGDYTIEKSGMTFYTVARLNGMSGTPYGTVEAALGAAISGDTVWIMPIENLQSQIPDGYTSAEGAITITSNATVKAGVTLILPQNANGDRNTDGASNGSGATALAGDNYLRTKLVIANGAVLTVNGTLEVNGVMSGGSAGGAFAGATVGEHAKLVIQGSGQIICNGVIRASGYITSDYGTYRPTNDKPSILVNAGGKVYQPLMLYDFMSGHYFAAIGYNKFNGKEPINGLNMTPFNESGFYNVQPFMRINSGGQMVVWANLDTSLGAQRTEAVFIGTTNADTHFIQLKSDAYITTEIKDSATRVVTVNAYGGMSIGNFKLTVNIKDMIDASASTLNTFFPLSWTYDITLHDGLYELGKQRLKIMWGAKLTVASDAILDASETDINVYDLNDLETFRNKIATQTSGTNSVVNYGAHQNKEVYEREGMLIVNGTLKAGAIGGKVYAEGVGASITVKTPTAASREAISFNISADGNVLEKLSAAKLAEIYEFTHSLELVGNGEITSGNSRPLFYNGTKWVNGVKVKTEYGDVVVVETDATAGSTYDAPEVSDAEREHYTFSEWYLDSAYTIAYPGNRTIPSDYVVTLYAKWTPTNYEIKYENKLDDNYTWSSMPTISGGDETFDITVTNGTLPTASSTVNTYVFLGWYVIDAEGKETRIDTINFETLVSYLTGDTPTVTIYAKWTQEKKYTFTFGENLTSGAPIPTEQSAIWSGIESIDGGKLPDYADTYNSNTGFKYEFKGWEVTVNGTTKIVKTYAEIKNLMGTEESAPESVTITAQWDNKVELTVKYTTNSLGLSTTGTKYYIVKGGTYTISDNVNAGDVNEVNKYYFNTESGTDGWSLTNCSINSETRVVTVGTEATATVIGNFGEKYYVTATKLSNCVAKVNGTDMVKNEKYYYMPNSVVTITPTIDAGLYMWSSTSMKMGNASQTLGSDKSWSGKITGNITVSYSAIGIDVCVTGDTLVTLADGSQKRIDEVTYNDQLLVWNFFDGKYDIVPSAIIFYHGDATRRVLKLNFSDGTSVKVLVNHGFYDVEENRFVFIDENNVESYIGHHYVKIDGNDYTSVELVGYEIFEEYAGSYSIQTAIHNNFMVEGMFSITMPHYEGWFDYFEIGEDMKYDAEKMQSDIEQYGLYTYEDFAEYVTYEQFIAFNGPYLKVLVGRGTVTYDQILELISLYVN